MRSTRPFVVIEWILLLVISIDSNLEYYQKAEAFQTEQACKDFAKEITQTDEIKAICIKVTIRGI